MTTTTQKAYKGMGMEGPVARWYTRTTHKNLHAFQQLGRRIEAIVPHAGRILEVAPGPGFLSIELARSGMYSVTGLDISKTFVEIARRGARNAGVRATFEQGDAAHMPFASGRFHFVVCRAAFKNFRQPVRAIAEMHRVLAPGGKAVILDLRRDVSWEDVSRYVEGLGLSAMSSWMTKATFRHLLMKRAYTLDQMRQMVAETPFGSADLKIVDLGFELWLEKKPASAFAFADDVRASAAPLN